MSRFSERSLFTLILIGIFVFGIGTGAGAAGFVVTRSMWNGINTKVNARATKSAVSTGDATLKKQIDDLTGQVAALQAANPGTADDSSAAALDEHVNDLIAKSQTGKTAEEAAAFLASVDTSALAKIKYSATDVEGVKGPNILFDGVNVFIRDGQNQGRDSIKTNGLGNLIMGYPGKYRKNDSDPEPTGYPARGGSHNIVFGQGNSWTAAYGLVGGHDNSLLGSWSAVIGGRWNKLAGGENVLLGGAQNNVRGGVVNTIVGGAENVADGWGNSVVGGAKNFSWSSCGVVVGGIDNGVGPDPGNEKVNTGNHAVVVGGTGYRLTAPIGIKP
jgi:hypothetical protein